MSLAVVDASVLVAFYAADEPQRDAVVARLTAGDALFAGYASLAERLNGPLITCDGKLAGASGPRCTFELIH